MKSIKQYIESDAIEGFSLETNDHIWLIDHYQRTAASALSTPEVGAILGLYMPYAFSIQKSLNGKPFVKSDGPAVFFSIAHSEQRIALLVSYSEPVGVDLELMRERAQRERIAKRFFGSESLSLSDFYEQWTAREALAKALDMGIYKVLSSQVEKTSQTIGFRDQTLRYSLDCVLLDQGFVLSACRALKSFPLLYFKARR